jgi:hypothetical protein
MPVPSADAAREYSFKMHRWQQTSRSSGGGVGFATLTEINANHAENSLFKPFRTLLTVALLGLPVSAIAAPGDEVLRARFGNTLIATTVKGVVTKFYYNADHTMTATRDGKLYVGTWQIAGERVCTFIALPGRGFPACFPAAAAHHEVGDTWKVGRGDTAGEETIVAGRH